MNDIIRASLESLQRTKNSHFQAMYNCIPNNTARLGSRLKIWAKLKLDLGFKLGPS